MECSPICDAELKGRGLEGSLVWRIKMDDEMFELASNHPYECQCEICKQWWDVVGLEHEDDDLIDNFDELPF